MPRLERLRADHAAAVRQFEEENRAYFTRFISDRGDDYFEHFDERHAALLTDQEAGNGAYHVLVDDDGAVLGRFNLILDGDGGGDGRAELGYRVAERAAGRGLATSAVEELCRRAATEYGVREVVAATSHENVASQRVLTKAGFVLEGPAAPARIGGKQGSSYRRELGEG